jgi:hypothetical protein
MPLRRWFREHGHPGWYSWVVVVGLTMASIGLSTVVNVNLTRRAIEADRQAQAEADRKAAAAAEAGRRTLCGVFLAQERVFTEAESDVGKAAAKAWHDLAVTYRCYER